MRCLFSSYCNEPKNLCCNFCSNKKCDYRCKDSYITCGLHDDAPLVVVKNIPNHIIGIRKNKDDIVFKDR